MFCCVVPMQFDILIRQRQKQVGGARQNLLDVTIYKTRGDTAQCWMLCRLPSSRACEEQIPLAIFILTPQYLREKEAARTFDISKIPVK